MFEGGEERGFSEDEREFLEEGGPLVVECGERFIAAVAAAECNQR